MRYSNILLEYRRDLTIKNYGSAIAKHFMTEVSGAIYQDSDNGDSFVYRLQNELPGFQWNKNEKFEDAIIRYFETIDPTSKKAYVMALARWYATGSMKKLEDALKAKPVILLFQKYANKIKGVNVMNITFDQFLDIGDELEDKKSRSEIAKEEEQKFYDDGEAKIFYNGPDYKIVIPYTEAAAQYFGRGTRWCTASREDNMFNYYNKDGPLFCILFKGKNQKWQFHFESDQFMDERDDSLDENTDEFKGVMKHFYKLVEELISNKIQGKDKASWSLIRLLPEGTYSDENWKEILNSDLNAVQYIPINKWELWEYAIEKEPEVVRLLQPSALRMPKFNPRWETDFKKEPDIANIYRKLVLKAIKIDGNVIRWVMHPTEEMQIIAVEYNPENLYIITQAFRNWNGHSMDELSQKAALIAVKQKGGLIINVPDPSPEIQMAAVKQDDRSLQYINNPTEEVIWYCLRKNVSNIVYVKGDKSHLITPEMQDYIAKNNYYLMRHIASPTPEAMKIAKRQENAAMRDRHSAYKKVR